MSRIHEERKDFYSSREGVLTSSSNIRSMPAHSQNMDKEKSEKQLFGQPTYVGETGFRTVDFIKQPPGRSIVPASLGAAATQLHAMPHLANYMTVPLSQARGQHFPTHIPVGLRAATVIAPPRATVTSQRLPSLKATNIPSQIQIPLTPLPSLPILPPSIASNNRTGSPTVSSHGLTTDSRLDARTHITDPHNSLRGNIQATSHNATIQVIASGSQVHLPTSLLSNKNSGFNASTNNMLKIGVNSHSNATNITPMPAPAFKVGIGKTYPGSSSVIIPVSSSKPEEHHSVSSFSRFTTPHNVTLHTTHHLQNLTATTSISNSPSSTTTTSSDPRTHANMSVPYAAAYVFHDIGSQISVHNFPHQLVRPPTTSGGGLPLFAVDSSHGLPTVPVVSIAVTKGHMLASDSNDNTRTEALSVHNNSTFNIQNLYPNLQTNNLTTTYAVVGSTNTEPSARPSILRKRPAEGTTTLFPVQPTEKERISSPIKVERSGPLSTRLFSPPKLTNEKTDVENPFNHSIHSLTSEVKSPTMLSTPVDQTTAMVSTSTNIVTTTKIIISAPPPLTNSLSMVNNSTSLSSLSEASPKKKPRKQHIITTEDKFGTTPINSTCATDEDEEFLKSNETMKDITPPKLVPAVPIPNITQASSAMKQLYTLSQQPRLDSKLEVKTEIKAEISDVTMKNGMVNPVTTSDTKQNDTMKYFLFRRRPQVGITNDCKINTKAAHNHFYRYSDIRVKEEKKTSTQEKLLSKSSLESASGWRVHHLSSQFDDLVSFEKGICEEIRKCKEIIPLPTLTSPTASYLNNEDMTEEDLQLRLLHELIQGSIQRCRCSVEQLEEAKTAMFKILDHKPKAMETLKKYKQKSKVKKKSS